MTHNSQVTLNHNDELIFYISADYSTYPGAVAFVLGGMPLGGPLASIPGTSGVYLPGLLFSGTIESQDGSVSVPFTDANAARLGLPGGNMVMVPGTHSGGSYSGSIDLLSAAANLSSQEAAALFGAGEAVIHLRNLGNKITFGYPGAAITNDFSASLTSSDGGRSMGAQVFRVQCVNTPEPATIGLLLIGLALMLPRVIRSSRRARG